MMSLFDVLRYPISDAPTAEELTALPTKLFRKWRRITEWENRGNYKTPGLIGEWYTSRDLTLLVHEIERREIKVLREMIKEYDEPV